MKHISIIICCHNSATRIRAALESIFKQEGISCDTQIVLVDNNCSDNTVHEAINTADRFTKRLTIVHEKTPGLIHARRAGAFAATGILSCFVDDDNLLDPHYLARAIEIFNLYPDIGYLGGISRLPHDHALPVWLTADLLLSYAVGRQYSRNGKLELTTPVLWGAGLCVRTLALQDALRDIESFKCMGRVGGRQLAGDDSELCYRLALLGWPGYHDDSLSLVHAIDPARFTVQRLLEMHIGFGGAKPILDALEGKLATQRGGKKRLRRIALYHPLGRLLVYAALTTLWSLRATDRITRLIRLTYYRAAFRASLRALYTTN